MSPKHYADAVLHSELSSTCKLTLLVISQCGDDWPGILGLCQLASLNERSVRRAIKAAEKSGWVKPLVKGDGQGWRRYGFELLTP